MLLPTTTVSIRTPTVNEDPYETGAGYTDDATGVPAHISSPSGRGTQSRDLVDAQLYIGPTPIVSPASVIVDEGTNDEWLVQWVDRRQGLGLDHQTAGLTRVGGAGG